MSRSSALRPESLTAARQTRLTTLRDAPVQHQQPLASSTSSVDGSDGPSPLEKLIALRSSSPVSPNSLSTTAIRSP